MSSTLFLALLAASGVNYDCKIDTPSAVSKAGASAIEGLPAEAMSFSLKLDGDEAKVDWPKSPIQMEGKQVVLPTGPQSGMVMFLSGGPCLFTESACGTMFNYARQPDGTLRFIATPTAVATDSKTEARSPFLVLIEGQCLPKKASK